MCFWNLPISVISVAAYPVFPSASVTVHVCTPASVDFRMFVLILLEELEEAKQSAHVDDHVYCRGNTPFPATHAGEGDRASRTVVGRTRESEVRRRVVNHLDIHIQS